MKRIVAGVDTTGVTFAHAPGERPEGCPPQVHIGHDGPFTRRTTLELVGQLNKVQWLALGQMLTGEVAPEFEVVLASTDEVIYRRST